MEKINRPTKEQVRQWLLDRRNGRKPLPDVEQIQRQLNWGRPTDSLVSDAPVTLEATCAISGW